MNVSSNIPTELKSFWKLFDQWSYRYDYATVFDDFLTMCIPNFSFEESFATDRDRVKEKYEEKEIQYFRECFFEMLNVYQDQLSTRSWYDFFGELYQSITSNWKSQRMGQFFTPEPVCDVITASILGDNVKDGETVNDPACGSSRMLLSAHGKTIYDNKKLYLVGQDVDPMCCKMSVLNFVFHGAEGEILCMNTLSNEFRFGYRVKTYPGFPVPAILRISSENIRLVEKEEREIKTIEPIKEDDIKDLEYAQGELFL